MPKFDIVTIGSAVKDVTFYTDQGRVIATPQNLTAQRLLAFEYGAKISVNEAHIGPGGGAANTAVSLSRLSFKVTVVTSIAQDEAGKEILKNFKQEKVNTNFVQKNSQEPTALSFILATDKKEREHVIFINRGADKHLFYQPKSMSRLNANWFYLTSLCGKACSRNLKEIFNFAAKKNIKITWNPGSVQLQSGKRMLAPFLKRTQVLILNKDEAIELTLSGIKLGRKNPNYLNRPLYLLNILQEWGPKIIVITDGKKGAWAYAGGKIQHQKIIQAKVIDTTGVGDAFGSAFLAGLIREKNDVAKALKWGIINSGSVVTKVGAQSGLLTDQQLLAKLP